MDLVKFIDGLVPWLKKELTPFTDRIGALEKELAETKSRLAAIESHGIKYVGVHQRSQDDYKKGNVVTFETGAWIALKDNPQGSPKSGGDWQLLIRGADTR